MRTLAPLVLLDLRGAGEQRLEIAELVDEEGRGLNPDARHARNVVGQIADQRLHLDHLRRRHPEALDHLRLGDYLVLHRVVHDDAGLHELHQVLVGRDDGHLSAGRDRLKRIGGDDVVGLVAFLLDAGDVEGAHSVAHERELGNEIVRRLGPVGLIAVEQIAAEGLGGIVEDHRDMAGRRELSRFPQQLPQHGAEPVHRADRKSVGGAGERRQGVIGAEDVARAVDQIDMVAASHPPAGGGSLALRHGHDGENIGIATTPREWLLRLIHHAISSHARP